ncbi:uncharacterized protein LOC144118999 isoform X4 [Amblyomma americanum]
MKPFVPSPGSTASPYPPTDSHSMRRPPPPGFRPPQGPPKSIYTVFNQQAERELYHHHEVTLSRN